MNFDGQFTIVGGTNRHINQVFLLPQNKIRLIGRSSICHFRLEDPLASSLHVLVQYKNNEFHIKDLLSANGLFVDDILVNEHLLEPGQKIKIGKTILEFDLYKEEDGKDYLTGEEKALAQPFLDELKEEAPKGSAHKPLGRLIKNLKDLNVLRLAIRYEIITHEDVKKILNENNTNICEILTAKNIISPNKIKKLLEEHRYNKIVHKDTVFGKWAIYCEMVEEKQVNDCFSWQEKCYKQGKKVPRLSEMMVEKNYLTLQQNNKLVKTLKNRDA